MDWNAYCPGGGTPLYDAIGKGISKTKAAIEREQNQACLDSAEREQARPQVSAQIEDGDHVLVTIITDGEENFLLVLSASVYPQERTENVFQK